MHRALGSLLLLCWPWLRSPAARMGGGIGKELVPGCCSCGPLLPRAGGGIGGWTEKELFLSITSQCRLSFPFFIPSRWAGELGGSSSLTQPHTQKVLAAWVPFLCGGRFGELSRHVLGCHRLPRAWMRQRGLGCACWFGVSPITVAFRHTAGFAG